MSASPTASPNLGEGVASPAIPAAHAAPADSKPTTRIINPDGLITADQEKQLNYRIESQERNKHIKWILDFENSFGDVDSSDWAEQVWAESGKDSDTVVLALSADRKAGIYTGGDPSELGAMMGAVRNAFATLTGNPPNYYEAAIAVMDNLDLGRQPLNTPTTSNTRSSPSSTTNSYNTEITEAPAEDRAEANHNHSLGESHSNFSSWRLFGGLLAVGTVGAAVATLML